jgi:parallel beta-helix repeat protein
MKLRLAIRTVILGLCAAALASAWAVAPALARDAGASKASKKAVFEACKHGCRYRTIQRAVDAAGAYKFENPKAKAVVAIRPGKYVEGVVVDGTQRRKDFDGLTIEGTKKNRKRVILEGKNAKGELGAAQNGIEAISVDGIVLRNMWARNYQSNGFFVHAATGGGQHCVGYTMDNLLASANRSYGLFAKNCFGGKMVNSAGFHHGDSAFYVGETPCDSRNWNVYGGTPCQRKPQWTLLKNDVSYENVLGYSGTNSKYVRIVESAFYNNGAGIVPNTLDSEGYEPNGWNIIERNDVFWNNYNYFLAGAAFHTVSAGLGELGGQTINYPTGVGIVLYGGDGNIVRRNKVFGNYKWGVASFSGPGETFVANEGNEAKNVNNQITENTMGREGADPNGEYDFWNDDTGGGNCWGGNNLIATFAPGNGSAPLSTIYPPCPQVPVAYASAPSLNTKAGLQINFAGGEFGDPKTILGYAGSAPPQNQQCTWVRRVAAHPPFQNYKPIEVAPAPGEVTC